MSVRFPFAVVWVPFASLIFDSWDSGSHLPNGCFPELRTLEQGNKFLVRLELGLQESRMAFWAKIGLARVLGCRLWVLELGAKESFACNWSQRDFWIWVLSLPREFAIRMPGSLKLMRAHDSQTLGALALGHYHMATSSSWELGVAMNSVVPPMSWQEESEWSNFGVLQQVIVHRFRSGIAQRKKSHFCTLCMNRLPSSFAQCEFLQDQCGPHRAGSARPRLFRRIRSSTCRNQSCWVLPCLARATCLSDRVYSLQNEEFRLPLNVP